MHMAGHVYSSFIIVCCIVINLNTVIRYAYQAKCVNSSVIRMYECFCYICWPTLRIRYALVTDVTSFLVHPLSILWSYQRIHAEYNSWLWSLMIIP